MYPSELNSKTEALWHVYLLGKLGNEEGAIIWIGWLLRTKAINQKEKVALLRFVVEEGEWPAEVGCLI